MLVDVPILLDVFSVVAVVDDKDDPLDSNVDVIVVEDPEIGR